MPDINFQESRAQPSPTESFSWEWTVWDLKVGFICHLKVHCLALGILGRLTKTNHVKRRVTRPVTGISGNAGHPLCPWAGALSFCSKVLFKLYTLCLHSFTLSLSTALTSGLSSGRTAAPNQRQSHPAQLDKPVSLSTVGAIPQGLQRTRLYAGFK